MVAVIGLSIKPDNCDRWQFYRKWLPGKTLAVYTIGRSKFNSTARNRLNFCKKEGYKAYHQDWSEWNNHLDDIFEINTSAEVRQGNPMSPGYTEYPSKKTIDNPCKNHKYHLVTVEKEKWYAYAIVHSMGELMNISTIIGHYDYLKCGIMLLLMEKIIEVAKSDQVKYIDYGEWLSGTQGLQYWKHSTGFEPYKINET